MVAPFLTIGLIGHGTVGTAFAAALASNADRITRRLSARLRLVQVAVRHPDRHRAFYPGIRVHDDAGALANDSSVDIVVEASGSSDASAWLRRAITRGAAAVTANKLALAQDRHLLDLLARRHPLLQCEAAVAAALPIVRALRDSLDGEEIFDVRGVLNATTTFILTQIEEGADFDRALALAREHGYAEADAATDLSGRDAAAKLAILATLAWRRPVLIDAVATCGIDSGIASRIRAAAALGSRVRLVANAWHDHALHLTVEPQVLAATDALFHAVGVLNVVQVQSALAGPLVWSGAGAGGVRTASALLGDVLVASRALIGDRAGRIAA